MTGALKPDRTPRSRALALSERRPARGRRRARCPPAHDPPRRRRHRHRGPSLPAPCKTSSGPRARCAYRHSSALTAAAPEGRSLSYRPISRSSTPIACAAPTAPISCRGVPAIRKQFIAAVQRALAQLDAQVPQPRRCRGSRGAGTKHVAVVRGVDRLELHPRRLHALCGRTVLAPNRQPAQRDASGRALRRKPEHGNTTYLQGLSTRAATRLEPQTFWVSVSTSIDEPGNEKIVDLQVLPSG
jgi:hypothetical protein